MLQHPAIQDLKSTSDPTLATAIVGLLGQVLSSAVAPLQADLLLSTVLHSMRAERLQLHSHTDTRPAVRPVRRLIVDVLALGVAAGNSPGMRAGLPSMLYSDLGIFDPRMVVAAPEVVLSALHVLLRCVESGMTPSQLDTAAAAAHTLLASNSCPPGVLRVVLKLVEIVVVHQGLGNSWGIVQQGVETAKKAGEISVGALVSDLVMVMSHHPSRFDVETGVACGCVLARIIATMPLPDHLYDQYVGAREG